MLFVDLCGFAALHGKWSFIIAIIAKNHFSQLSYLRVVEVPHFLRYENRRAPENKG